MKKQTRDVEKTSLRKELAIRILTTFASTISILFGVWHFFVPSIWDWYSYIDKQATELAIAVRAINIFFSLLLVLLGIANIILVFRKMSDTFSTATILSISIILWATRVVLQIIYPQASQNPIIQYSMFGIFIIVFACLVVSAVLIIKKNK